MNHDARFRECKVHHNALKLELTAFCLFFIHIIQINASNTLRVIKSRRMRWAGHVERMGEERGVYRVSLGKPEWKETTGETYAHMGV